MAHLYIGEEAVAVGVCEALRRDDYITSTHRGHGHCLAKGAAPDRMFAELLGKEAGYCKGKGGSMHIADPDTGNLGANAIVAGQRGHRHGRGVFREAAGHGRVAVCFFGEGALGQGVLYEVMNMAALWKLPVIYVCENNMYNEYTHYSETTAGDPLAARRWVRRACRKRRWAGRASGLCGHGETGGACAPRRRSRRFCGPIRIASRGHHVGDISREYYRAKQEEQQWKTERDPHQGISAWLIEQNVASACGVSIRCKPKSKRKWKRPCSSRWRRRIRTPLK